MTSEPSPPATMAPAPAAYPLDPAWTRAWADNFLGHGNWIGPTRTYEVEEPSPLGYATACFARQRFGPLVLASLAGYYWPSRGVAVGRAGDPQAAARRLAAAVARDPPGHLLRLGPLSSDDAATAAFVAALHDLGWKGVRRVCGNTYALSAADAAGFTHAASASMLKNLTYLRRRLDKQHGQVSVERFVLDRDMPPSLLQRLASIERASWVADDDGEPKFLGDRNARFWGQVAIAEPHGTSRAVVWLLGVGDRDVAFSAHFETPDRIWIIANSYDSAWKAHSPGSLLTLAVLGHAQTYGPRHIDWGQGDSGYKARWGAVPGAELNEVLLFRPSTVGMVLWHIARSALRGWRVA